MSADAQSALSDEFSSTATPFIQSQTHLRSTLLQQKPITPDRHSPARVTTERSVHSKGQEIREQGTSSQATAFEPLANRPTENLPIVHPSHAATLPLNYPSIPGTSDQQISPHTANHQGATERNPHSSGCHVLHADAC